MMMARGTTKRVRRRFLPATKVGVAAALVAACAACGSSSHGASSSSTAAVGAAQGKPQYGGDITVAVGVAASSLDPVLAVSGADPTYLYPIYARLINFTPNLQLEPGLATSWKFTDPTTLVLTLRSGVTFSDGTPFNAAAVQFNLDRARTLKTSAELQDLAAISSVTADSPTQVTIHLSRPDSGLPSTLSQNEGMMESPTAVQKEGASYPLHPVGAGPFEVSSYVPNQSVTLVKNPTYYVSGQPYLSGIKILYISDPATEVAALKSGEVNIATGVGTQYVSGLEADSQFVVQNESSLSMAFLGFNMTKPPFNNLQARQAVQAAMDPSALSTALYNGIATPNGQFFPKGYYAHNSSLPVSLYNPAKAKQLASESGLTNTTITGLAFSVGNIPDELSAIAGELGAVGIHVKQDDESVAAGVTDYYVDHKENFDTSQFTLLPDAGATYSELVAPGGFYSPDGDTPSSVDTLLSQGQAAPTLSGQEAAYQSLAQLIQSQALIVPFASTVQSTAYGRSLENFTPNLTGQPDLSTIWVSK